jgi:endonuclease/exonuclease/phosphatase family metal-dependent hydrolase
MLTGGNAEAKRQKESSFKVMSYNVHYGVGMDGKYDVGRIADTIVASGADIVALQEVDVHWSGRSQYEDMAGTLAAKLGMQVYVAPIYELPPAREGEEARRFGNALLSRVPIVNAVNYKLTRLSTQDPTPRPMPMPGFAEVKLDMGGTALTVYVAHLDYRSDPAIRIVQVREMLDIMGGDTGRKLVVGDFNARPDAHELFPLFAVFRDTWKEVRNEPGFTFPADMPDRKIDYILAGSGVETIRSDIADVRASDHRPLTAEFRLSF